MPTSAVIELMHVRGVANAPLVRFSGDVYTDSKYIEFQIPLSLWKELGSPEGLRVRIEDIWNDPNRKW